MKTMLILGVLVLAALPTAALSAETMTAGTKGNKPYLEAVEKTTKQATVIGIDKASRYVTLKGEHGDTLRIKAGEQVKNFGQIKVGDLVKITYTERLTIHVEGAGTPEMVTQTSSTGAKPGEKPSGSVTERTQYKATIVAIDKKNGTATLRGYEGEDFVITPLHPENLDKVSVGELVVFTQTTAVAASVEKVAAKKK